MARTSAGVSRIWPSAEDEAVDAGVAPRKRIKASIVSRGRSSMTQCPVFGSTSVSTFVATSFACFPSASPFAFSPPIASTGIVSLV